MFPTVLQTKPYFFFLHLLELNNLVNQNCHPDSILTGCLTWIDPILCVNTGWLTNIKISQIKKTLKQIFVRKSEIGIKFIDLLMLKGWCIEFVLFIIWFGNLVATNIIYLLLEITPLIFNPILFGWNNGPFL